MHKSNPKFRHLAFCMTVYACLKNKFTRLESAKALLKYLLLLNLHSIEMRMQLMKFKMLNTNLNLSYGNVIHLLSNFIYDF